ncbi:MAG: rhomboid family intramembrane serine protease [Candidatus Eisenbacteria bacterium]
MTYYGQQPGRRGFLMGSSLSNAVRMLIAWNVILFLVQLLLPGRLEHAFGLIPSAVMHGKIWQLVTYMFLHSTHGLPLHLLFNMAFLWMFGSELEGMWGTPRFVKYYFFTGIGAGITQVVVSLIMGGGALMLCPICGSPHEPPTIGASGAIFGLLLAYGMMFPDRPVLLYFLIPIKAKYFVIGLGLRSSGSPVRTTASPTSRISANLFGYIYLRSEGGSFGGWGRRRRKQQFRVLEFRDRDDEDQRWR